MYREKVIPNKDNSRTIFTQVISSTNKNAITEKDSVAVVELTVFDDGSPKGFDVRVGYNVEYLSCKELSSLKEGEEVILYTWGYTENNSNLYMFRNLLQTSIKSISLQEDLLTIVVERCDTGTPTTFYVFLQQTHPDDVLFPTSQSRTKQNFTELRSDNYILFKQKGHYSESSREGKQS